jgi:hypothetical protein
MNGPVRFVGDRDVHHIEVASFVFGRTSFLELPPPDEPTATHSVPLVPGSLSLSSGQQITTYSLVSGEFGFTERRWDEVDAIRQQIVDASCNVRFRSVTPDGVVSEVLLRLSAPPSGIGSVLITGLPDGQYFVQGQLRFTSEISFDNGASWIGSEDPMLLTPIPAPAASSIVGLGCLVAARRRRA